MKPVFDFDLQLFASSAGMNRVTSLVLPQLTTTTTAVATPLTGYGTIGINDSGPIMLEARDFTKWTFQLLGGGTGYQVSVYGTVDWSAYAAWMAARNPQMYAQRVGGQPTCPASSWFLLPGPSEQAGTGVEANPMTEASPILQYSGTLIGIRAVLTTVGTAGIATVSVEATP